MSTAAIMIVKDEADILERVLLHTKYHVDELIVTDNQSTDGSDEIIAALADHWWYDTEVGYFQSDKMTQLALYALKKGHDWVIPVDADEVWYVEHDAGLPIKDFLGGLVDAQVVTATMFNHIPTALDPADWLMPDRIRWHKRQPGRLPKVACRTEPSMKIGMGNHDVSYDGRYFTVNGLHIRHFSWRSEEQYIRKIRNGAAAYVATGYPDTVGAHWRMWDGASDAAIAQHFRRWFYCKRPNGDGSLVEDPAPIRA